MLDIKLFRENPEIILESEKKRFRDNHFAEKVIEYDTLWREGERKLNSLRQEKNKLSKSFKQAKKDGNFEEVVAKSKAVAAEIKELSAKGAITDTRSETSLMRMFLFQILKMTMSSSRNTAIFQNSTSNH